ncbi:hypothetical protein O0882_21295 [Janthinobacterium sp. SUN073]|uniref:hypothetical protein n=1 Tax=Janthinobacterium sp. SUN073 TaxID=3004102 RepID=UPI0025B046FB|nr:hypothetical protein [Janthinobacterium sp. SUN073]MDN2698858.1 hypothetical protein [Janthinobacterium sp. SUN073]
MLSQFKKSVLASTLLYIAGVSATYAAEEKQYLISAKPGKEVCVADEASKSQVCVAGGNFSHDVYSLKIDGSTVLKGIDDQLSVGLAGNYQNQAIAFVCEAQNIFPKETPEATLAEVQRLMPNSPPERIKTIAGLLRPGPMGMEIGRLCKASRNGQAFITVQVMFD